MRFLDKVVCKDCMDVLPSIQNESVDMVFADPPFNVGKKYDGQSDRRNGEEYRSWCEGWIQECFRVLKPTGTFYLMTLSRHLDWLLPVMAAHGVFINLVCWWNVSASHRKRCFWGAYQPIAVYGKTEDYIFNTYAQIFDEGHRRWGSYSTGFKGQLKDFWRDIPFVYAGSIHHKEAIIEPGTNRKVNPSQMPLSLVYRAIVFSTEPDGLVLDPLSGVGTTAIAAIAAGRHYICIEQSEKYTAIARGRIASALTESEPAKLFGKGFS